MNSKLKVIKCHKDCESKFRKPFPLLRILSPDGRIPFPSESVNEKVMEVVPPIPIKFTLFFKKILLFIFLKKLFSVQNVLIFCSLGVN